MLFSLDTRLNQTGVLFKNRSEFREAFEEYYNPLCNFGKYFLDDDEAIEDIVQEVFLHIWKKREELQLTSDLKSYLFQATKNKVFETLRKNKSYENLIAEYDRNKRLSAEEDVLANRLLKLERINKSLRHLPPKCKEVFVLHKYKGLTYAEIAEQQNISVKTVENHMLKAIKLIRDLLAN